MQLEPKELAHRLTMSGTEVESLRRVGADWRRIVIARVAEIARMPKSNNLFVAEVDAGAGLHTVVTGAPNLKGGELVPWVQPDGALPGGRQIARRTFRGVESAGMLCAADELELGLDHDGIYVLDPGAPVGMSLAEYLDEWILEFKITPNRPDTMNAVGVAREIAALLDHPLRTPSFPEVPDGPAAEEVLSVVISDPDLCARYSAALVFGTNIRPSPSWLQRRLFFCGVRPISNVVDVTN